jgi:hypothetical protein
MTGRRLTHHFGIPVGFRRNGLKKRVPTELLGTERENAGTWFNSSLPRPAHVPEGMEFKRTRALTTCLIVLFLYLIAPGLKRNPAFNKEGAPWYALGVKASPGEVVVSHCDDVKKVMEFTALSAARQQALKETFLLQSGPRVTQLGQAAPAHAQKRAITHLNARAPQ